MIVILTLNSGTQTYLNSRILLKSRCITNSGILKKS